MEKVEAYYDKRLNAWVVRLAETIADNDKRIAEKLAEMKCVAYHEASKSIGRAEAYLAINEVVK